MRSTVAAGGQPRRSVITSDLTAVWRLYWPMAKWCAPEWAHCQTPSPGSSTNGVMGPWVDGLFRQGNMGDRHQNGFLLDAATRSLHIGHGAGVSRGGRRRAYRYAESLGEPACREWIKSAVLRRCRQYLRQRPRSGDAGDTGLEPGSGADLRSRERSCRAQTRARARQVRAVPGHAGSPRARYCKYAAVECAGARSACAR